MTTVGERLVEGLKAHGVRVVFGIPGVHTVELYRGLAGSGIHHVTPRHEQGAGFMADGYARVSGEPGVAFVITGPGLTNTLTPMAQARADSVPILVVSGVNRRDTLGKGFGHLHELPDQRGMTALVALSSERVVAAAGLGASLETAWTGFATSRPGPRHIEVPTDVMALDAPPLPAVEEPPRPMPSGDEIAHAADRLAGAATPLILAGGGAKRAGAALQALAERLGAPVVQTVNARGLMHGHPLTVAASPCLEPVRDLVREADVVLAVGTEFGPTEYDMHGGGGFPCPRWLIRIEVDADQLARHPVDLGLVGHAESILPAILATLPDTMPRDGADRAATARTGAWATLDDKMWAEIAILEALRDARPGSIIVGDSTQAVYSGNLWYDHDRPGGWFNAATGYGALGFAIPAAIGAAIAAPDAPVICLTGDGGAQFTLPELMTAVDERLPITFLIWNNRAYGEIATSMQAVGVEVIGCHPTPPDFEHVAASCGMPYRQVAMTPAAVVDALGDLKPTNGPAMIEIAAWE